MSRRVHGDQLTNHTLISTQQKPAAPTSQHPPPPPPRSPISSSNSLRLKLIQISKYVLIHYVVRAITLLSGREVGGGRVGGWVGVVEGSPLVIMFVRCSHTQAGPVPGQIGLRLPTFPQVFYYPWAEGIMWLLGDALCSATHYYPDAASATSLTPHYDLLYTSQRRAVWVSHVAFRHPPLFVRGLKVKFLFKQVQCNWIMECTYSELCKWRTSGRCHQFLHVFIFETRPVKWGRPREEDTTMNSSEQHLISFIFPELSNCWWSSSETHWQVL